MKKFVFFLTAVAMLGLAPLVAEEPPKKSWADEAQLSFLNANGNTKSKTLGFSNLFTWTKGRFTLELPAGALNSTSDGVRIAEKYYAGEKGKVQLSHRNYAYEKFQWERDTFAGFAHRYDSSVGFGRELVKTSRNLFLLELGGGYLNEQRVDSERVDFASGRAYGKYTYKISETAEFLQDGEYLHNFDESRDYRTRTQTALVASLSAKFALKVSYTWDYRNMPPAGFVKNDTLTAVSLVVKY